ncbi:Acetyl-coenzyme A carboxylase carboxyl transferase subunit alpha, chloroplastic, partial [Mucuna pruriens]
METLYYLANYFLGCSFKSATIIWPKYLNGARNNRKDQKFHVAAKIRKVKKHDYPWPDNMESKYYLFHFKPLAEKPKPVRRMADDTGLDFSNQIGALESKYQQLIRFNFYYIIRSSALKDLYKHLTPIQHPNRPTVLDHILNIIDKWIELHGDRAGYDDPAMVTGIGSMMERVTCLLTTRKVGTQRKTLLATLQCQLLMGEAIAKNVRFKVPIITVVTGEGGSGGDFCLICCKAAEKLRITAQENYRPGIDDGVIPEVLGGARADPTRTSQQIKLTITQATEELTKMDARELLHHRHLKFGSIGGFQEGKPVEPKRKRNMKPTESEEENFRSKGTPFEFDSFSKEAIQKLVKMEQSKASSYEPLIKEKVDNIMQEIKSNMSQPGAYAELKQKLQKLDNVNRS